METTGSELFDECSFDHPAVVTVAKTLGPLPPTIRYFDEYEEKIKSVNSGDNTWKIAANGRILHLNFEAYKPSMASILKHFTANRLHKNAVTATGYMLSYTATKEWQIPLLILACQGPRVAIEHLRTEFHSSSGTIQDSKYFTAGKALLYFLCEAELAGWDASYANVLRSISSPVVSSKHRTVRDGSAIISFEEEYKIIGYLDDLNAKIIHGSAEEILAFDLRDACILFWNYAHGMRPIQIANRNINHIRIRKQVDGSPVVHLTFRYAKQRSSNKVMEQTRKMKRDWTPMMGEWLKRRALFDPKRDFDRPKSLFGVSPHDIGKIVTEMTVKITGVRRVPYGLRHSAAQRKADAGCSRIELAEFLMHQDINTADTYIEMSPTQAEKINQALGLSPLFQAIDKAIKSRSIDLDDLHQMPADMQVGSAPHGHLIAGIGGCAIGQSFCTKTPALACYECPKFLYLRDLDVHRAARDSVRDIIQEFIAAGRTDRASPAFMQLRRVIETIEAVIEDIEGETEGACV